MENNNIEVKIKKLHQNAMVPSYSKVGDMGFDLTAVGMVLDHNTNLVTYETGLAFQLPEGYGMLLFPRSSIKNKKLELTNSVGVVDSGYRGEIKAVFRLTEELINTEEIYNIGDRICQGVILPYPQVKFIESEILSETDRGGGGFGSTGN